MGSVILSADQTGIATILRSYTLRVLQHQREYSWTDKEVRALFHDVNRAMSDHDDAYFLGSIVAIPEKDNPNVLRVVDGQQRSATTAILIAAIRDYLKTRPDDSELADSLHKTFLTEYDRNQRTVVSRLQLSVVDREFFMRRVIEAQPRAVKHPTSHRRINRAAEIAQAHVYDLVKGHGKSAHGNVLNKWVDYLEHSTQVVLLKVPSEANAYRMFETLNDRGLRTTQADLVKNHLFGEAGDARLEEAQQKWSTMRGILEATADKAVILNYLRQMLISHYGYMKKEDVYQKAAEQSRGSSRSIAFITKLEEGAADYVAILNPEHEKWSAYEPTTRSAIRTLALVKMGFMRPIMLAVARHFKPREADKAFRVVIRLTVRFMIAGGATSEARSATVEEALADAAKRIDSGAVTTAAALLRELGPIAPKDAQFVDSFTNATSSKPKLARYYLASLETAWKKLQYPLYVTDEPTGVRTLEHVLPLRPGTAWPQFTADDSAAFSKRLGNMTLLETKLNSKIKSESFDNKRAVYGQSVNPLTQQIAHFEEWGVSQIVERQKSMAAYAVKVWALSAD